MNCGVGKEGGRKDMDGGRDGGGGERWGQMGMGEVGKGGPGKEGGSRKMGDCLQSTGERTPLVYNTE